MGSSPDINYPAQPSYGEGMREALEAQVALLTGGKVGEADFTGVGSLESLLPLEESIRRKTAQTDTDILRQTLLGSEQKVVRDPQTGKFGIPGAEPVLDESGNPQTAGGGRYQIIQTAGAYDPQEIKQGGRLGGTTYVPGQTPQYAILDTETGGITETFGQSINYGTGFQQVADANKKVLESVTSRFRELENTIRETGNVNAPTESFEFTNPNTGEPLQEGDVVRTGDGMVDLLGDRRAVQEFETRTATQADVDAGLADEVGAQFVTQKPTTRQAGFDESGNFLGLAALSEDLQRSNLSRQREADLQDVSRLSGLYSDIMQDYKPGTQEALQSARDVLEAQGENLTGAGAIDVPDPTAFSNVQAGQMSGDLGLGEDALRTALLTDAKQALGQGLTDREERQIAEAARARSTMMGRTFDQSGAIAEAEARVAEDNQRRMQNRAFAQQALGQEAGLQESDLRRDMQAELANQQGSQFGAGAKMDAQRLNEQLRQQGTLGYLQAAGQLAALEDRTTLDPFQAVLGRGGGNALQQGQSVFGQAGYGLNSGPQYLNPEAGLGFIQNQATNAANMYGAQLAADANRSAGIMGGLGSIGGGLAQGIGAAGSIGGFFCWVAREVYGEKNPAWKMFRMWMFLKSPNWFFNLYKKYGERFARFIKDKPRLKAIIRMWMDSKIRR